MKRQEHELSEECVQFCRGSALIRGSRRLLELLTRLLGLLLGLESVRLDRLEDGSELLLRVVKDVGRLLGEGSVRASELLLDVLCGLAEPFEVRLSVGLSLRGLRKVEAEVSRPVTALRTTEKRTHERRNGFDNRVELGRVFVQRLLEGGLVMRDCRQRKLRVSLVARLQRRNGERILTFRDSFRETVLETVQRLL